MNTCVYIKPKVLFILLSNGASTTIGQVTQGCYEGNNAAAVLRSYHEW